MKNLELQKSVLGSVFTNCYFLMNKETKEMIIVDPADSPELRGHFAEFLDNASSVGLRILSSSTCVGFRYGYCINNSGFS